MYTKMGILLTAKSKKFKDYIHNIIMLKDNTEDMKFKSLTYPEIESELKQYLLHKGLRKNKDYNIKKDYNTKFKV